MSIVIVHRTYPLGPYSAVGLIDTLRQFFQPLSFFQPAPSWNPSPSFICLGGYCDYQTQRRVYTSPQSLQTRFSWLKSGYWQYRSSKVGQSFDYVPRFILYLNHHNLEVLGQFPPNQNPDFSPLETALENIRYNPQQPKQQEEWYPLYDQHSWQQGIQQLLSQASFPYLTAPQCYAKFSQQSLFQDFIQMRQREQYFHQVYFEAKELEFFAVLPEILYQSLDSPLYFNLALGAWGRRGRDLPDLEKVKQQIAEQNPLNQARLKVHQQALNQLGQVNPQVALEHHFQQKIITALYRLSLEAHTADVLSDVSTHLQPSLSLGNAQAWQAWSQLGWDWGRFGDHFTWTDGHSHHQGLALERLVWEEAGQTWTVLAETLHANCTALQRQAERNRYARVGFQV